MLEDFFSQRVEKLEAKLNCLTHSPSLSNQVFLLPDLNHNLTIVYLP